MTRYPLMLVHGTGFRDRRILQYWGRIPKTLESYGAKIYYGGQDGWGTIQDNGETLRQTLLKVLEVSGCDKVNILAHSKGGLDARYMITALDCAPYVASLTTISTPHHGSRAMDGLIRMPEGLFHATGAAVNLIFRLQGDKKPDFCTACVQFTTVYMRAFNDMVPDAAGVCYQSCATAMKGMHSDMLMCIPYLILRFSEGENDGLVTPSSARHGSFLGVWRGAGRRGISHLDAVDFRRRPLSRRASGDGIIDITEQYVALVERLKEKGY